MAKRLLRDSILTSEVIDKLDYAAEVFYRRLMSVVDDFGRFDARPSILKAACYPLRLDQVREADVTRWIAECEMAGAIALYESDDGKPYLVMLRTDRPRAKQSRYPEPPAEVECWRWPEGAKEAVRAQMRADARKCSHMRPYSDAYSDANADADAGISASGDADRSKPARKPRTKPNTPHHQAIRFFCERWEAKYGRPFPFGTHPGKNGELVKRILLGCGGCIETFEAAIGRYLACDDRFLTGHPLAMLASQIEKFIVEPVPVRSKRERDKAEFERELDRYETSGS